MSSLHKDGNIDSQTIGQNNKKNNINNNSGPSTKVEYTNVTPPANRNKNAGFDFFLTNRKVDSYYQSFQFLF